MTIISYIYIYNIYIYTKSSLLVYYETGINMFQFVTYETFQRIEVLLCDDATNYRESSICNLSRLRLHISLYFIANNLDILLHSVKPAGCFVLTGYIEFLQISI